MRPNEMPPLQWLRDQKNVVLKRARPPVIKKERKQQTLLRIKEEVIRLRFGSTYQQVRTTHQVISEKLGLKVSTTRQIVRTFVRGGYAFRPTRERRPRTIIPDEVLKHVLSKRTLYLWRLMSLEKHCLKVLERFGTKINRMQLSKLYKQHGIRHRRPKYSISCRRPDEQLLLLQQRFCEQLVEKLRRHQEVI